MLDCLGMLGDRGYLDTSLVRGLTTVLAVNQRPLRGFLNEKLLVGVGHRTYSMT